jgi:hypothetical protein
MLTVLTVPSIGILESESIATLDRKIYCDRTAPLNDLPSAAKSYLCYELVQEVSVLALAAVQEGHPTQLRISVIISVKFQLSRFIGLSFIAKPGFMGQKQRYWFKLYGYTWFHGTKLGQMIRFRVWKKPF